ncbi:hypothetical protein IC232_20930 [Microvirga sp. BT688]|uniref:hypothetical protein n=1 Tax=Microvirga sp. TaxID=1873136 RepID=UPI001685BCC9|nr:hypothetical protein [Microvirga sp.]MBD2749149.1 hypothetical protein [Microvirga sp.]
MPKRKDPDDGELTQEEVVDALLLRIAAYTIVLERQVTEQDYKRLRTLRAFLKAAEKLIAEIGSQDEQ